LSLGDEELASRLLEWRERQTDMVAEFPKDDD
jgi:5-(carboxyamino)imidazole ribonucleotide mutase